MSLIKSSHHNRTYFYIRSENGRLSTEAGIVFRRASRCWVAKRIVGAGEVETEHTTRSDAEAVFGEAEEVGR
jgi:hypothetical protein